jgi:hypothetical protein
MSMKVLSLALCFVFSGCVVVTALAEPQRDDVRVISVPAGDLSEAVELLARQAGVEVTYQDDALRGFRTAGIQGAFEVMTAFGKLLEGTPLVATWAKGKLLIARSPDAVCHRVSEGNLSRVYCGKAAQWSDLQARVGFRCRNQGKDDELCATAREWKRLELIEATQQDMLNKSSKDSYQATVDGNRQTATDMQAAGVRPVMPPAPGN